MVLKGHGLNEKWNHNSILGYSDTETVKLDFDNTPFRTVRYWALRTMKWHKLEGYIIFKSSEKCYHVVFNRPVSWSENMKIVAWVSLLSHKETVRKWLEMQCIKQSSTLRVSPKKEKPSPRIVYSYGRQDKGIKSFLLFRKQIKDIIRRMDTKREKRVADVS